MKRKVDMDSIFLVFCDLMLWSSIPMTLGAGIWETHLAISETSHTLVQIMLLTAIIGWVWFWFFTGEQRRSEYQFSNTKYLPHQTQNQIRQNIPLEQDCQRNIVSRARDNEVPVQYEFDGCKKH
jgi:hypothetical protein